MNTLRKLATQLAILLMPNRLTVLLLNLLGHRIGSRAYVGFSVIWGSRLFLSGQSRIGHLNFIACRRLVMRRQAYIGRLNYLRGPFSVQLDERGSIGNQNQVVRAPRPISISCARLKLGKLAKITAGHKVDCMSSIELGHYTTIAGTGTQMWTHGYYHYPQGPDRFRVDGKIVIGNNVYIGSMCVVSMGVNIADAVVVGSHASISKSLDKPGLYVSQPLRYIETNVDTVMSRLEALPHTASCERVFRKPAGKSG